jgi:carbon storage regulator
MLVLSRRAGEAIMIDGIRVVVLEMRRGHVKLGFEAPETTKILREELLNGKRNGQSGDLCPVSAK